MLDSALLSLPHRPVEVPVWCLVLDAVMEWVSPDLKLKLDMCFGSLALDVIIIRSCLSLRPGLRLPASDALVAEGCCSALRVT